MAFGFDHARSCDEKKLAPAYRDLMRCTANVEGMSHIVYLTIAASLRVRA
jgi:hypothetical protein